MGTLAPGINHHPLRVRAGRVTIDADLNLPTDVRGLVLFAHGSGSSRFSPRNRFVAGQLGKAGLATVLADLLTSEEEEIDERTRHSGGGSKQRRRSCARCTTGQKKEAVQAGTVPPQGGPGKLCPTPCER